MRTAFFFSTPRVYILYKNACQPRQPVKIRLFLLPLGAVFLVS